MFLMCSVLSPILNMPISESKRQRVLVACCVLYAEVCELCLLTISYHNGKFSSLVFCLLFMSLIYLTGHLLILKLD